jgi:hypothetical protein
MDIPMFNQKDAKCPSDESEIDFEYPVQLFS